MRSFLFISLFFITFLNYSQEKSSNLKIYFDCEYCNDDFYKQELSYVDFVRDRKDADVHILFTTQNNASGGDFYVVEFIGQNDFTKLKRMQEFSTTGETTDDEQRKIILKNIKFGLMDFWFKKGLKDKITIIVQKSEKDQVTVEKDPWNKWSFRLGLRGYFNGEESNTNRNINGSFRISQVTEKNKFSLRAGISNNTSIYKFDGEEILSERKRSYAYINDVISINNHWSVGAFVNGGNSLYSNKSFYYSIKPAVEYNFYDYKDSQKKALVISYSVGSVFNRYYDLTIFGKEKELLWQQNLSLDGSLVKKWGNISGGIAYRSYLHDFDLNGFNFNLETSLKLFKGFSLDFYGQYGLSHDQINLRSDGASLEELLLAQQQVKSGYNYYGSVGVSYTFGSIYNTIVNPRFDL